MGCPFSCHCQLVSWAGRHMAVAVEAGPGRDEDATVGDAATPGPLGAAAWGATGCAVRAQEVTTARDTTTVTQRTQRVEVISWNLSQQRVGNRAVRH